MLDVAAIAVQPGTFLAVIVAAALAGAVAAALSGRGVVIPVVVIELVFGVILGPQVVGFHVDSFLQFFSNLGLALLFFFAGYEIDIHRISGQPLRLGLTGWVISLVLAYALASALWAVGVVVSVLFAGSALMTTALGTLLPILSDAGELKTKFGTFMLGAGAVGEFGPILVITLVLSAQGTLHNAVILIAFIATAVAIALASARSSVWTMPLFERTLETSSQLAVRWILVLIFALVLLAFKLGLDLLLGGFAAGLIVGHVLGDREVPLFESKLTAIAFGAFIPFFFIVSGMNLDVDALFGSVGSVLKMLLFFVLFLVVRGTPAMLLYRRELKLRDRKALALMSSTQLPLVLAITTLAIADHHMRASTASALIGAAVLSTLVYPILGLRLRGDIEEFEHAHVEAQVVASMSASVEASTRAPAAPRS
ncbi:MAG TPA: cation:proton antiporter [Solirubrobacteraceae bacterium]|nr:cation:proton antiporter [Solirubrobacteraceae bacterium]